MSRVLEGLGLSAQDVGRRCLVIGGAGYFGGHLVAALVGLGCEVHSFDRARPGEPREGVTEIEGDIRDPEALRLACAGMDTVFHAAAVMNLLGVAKKGVRAEVFAINVGGTEKVISACRLGGVGRLVYTSSANVAFTRECHEVDESAGYADSFVDLYGETKVAAERAVLGADGGLGLRTVALRPGGLWGPGEGGLMIQTFLGQLLAGRFVAAIGDGEAVVDNTHVWNLIRAELLAAAALGRDPERVGGQAYFVTDDERLNGVEWFRPLVEGLGYTMPTRRIPGRLMYGIAWSLEHLHALGAPEPPVTRIGVLKLVRPSAFRIDRAREELGYAPIIGQAEGLALHMEDYRASARFVGDDAPEGWAERDEAGRRKHVFILHETAETAERSPAARREVLLDRIVPACRELGAGDLNLCIHDEHADPVGSPNPINRRRSAGLLSLWIAEDAVAACVERLREQGFAVEGYRVAESVYMDYGGNRHSPPRDWPDGQRSPGITAVTLLTRPPKLSRAEWIRRWQSRMSPVSERIQPRTRYVRNLVLARVTDNAPRFEGIVEEVWASPAHVRNPFLFYGAKNVLELARNMAAILRTVTSFLRMRDIETSMMSEYLMGSGPSGADDDAGPPE